MKTVLLACALLLGGCASANRLRTDLSAPLAGTGREVVALTNNLRAAYLGCGGAAPGDCRMNTALTTSQLSDFVGAGAALSDYYCDTFFRSANQSARHRRFARNLNNDVGGALAAVLALAKAGSGVVGGVASGFSLADGSFRNYDDSYMVDADLAKLRRLVLAAQDNMKLQLRDNPPNTVFAAETTIIRYAGLCSFLGMQDLLNDSVAAKTATIEDDNRAKLPTRVNPAPSSTPAPAATPTTPSVSPPAPVG